MIRRAATGPVTTKGPLFLVIMTVPDLAALAILCRGTRLTPRVGAAMRLLLVPVVQAYFIVLR